MFFLFLLVPIEKKSMLETSRGVTSWPLNEVLQLPNGQTGWASPTHRFRFSTSIFHPRLGVALFLAKMDEFDKLSPTKQMASVGLLKIWSPPQDPYFLRIYWYLRYFVAFYYV